MTRAELEIAQNLLEEINTEAARVLEFESLIAKFDAVSAETIVYLNVDSKNYNFTCDDPADIMALLTARKVAHQYKLDSKQLEFDAL